MMRTEMIIRRIAASVLIFVSSYAFSQATSIPTNRLINPEDLIKILQSGKEQPLVLQTGSHNLFLQAHIPGSEYVGAASTDTGLQQLRKRVDSLPRNKFIVLYCGCCPWSQCPNVKPADDAMHELGFTNVKVLYISDNFGTNWVDKGFPTAKGE